MKKSLFAAILLIPTVAVAQNAPTTYTTRESKSYTPPYDIRKPNGEQTRLTYTTTAVDMGRLIRTQNEYGEVCFIFLHAYSDRSPTMSCFKQN